MRSSPFLARTHALHEADNLWGNFLTRTPVIVRARVSAQSGKRDHERSREGVTHALVHPAYAGPVESPREAASRTWRVRSREGDHR